MSLEVCQKQTLVRDLSMTLHSHQQHVILSLSCNIYTLGSEINYEFIS